VTLWPEIFLGIIAVATITTAILQVGVLLAAGRMLRHVQQLIDRVDRELAPTFGHVNVISRDVARAVALATAQVERVDLLVSDLTQRLEDLAASVQKTLAMPAREAKAILNALKVALDVLREARRRPGRPRVEDDDALFI